MVWDKIFESFMPDLFARAIPLSMQFSPFALLKRPWSVAFSFETMCIPAADSSVTARLKVVIANKNCTKTRARPVARTLIFGDQGEEGEVQSYQGGDIQDSLPSPATIRKKRGKKVKAPLVLPEERRFTRSCLKKDGYRPAPIVMVQKGPKKRVRSRLFLCSQGDEAQMDGTEGDHEAEAVDQGDVAPEEEPVNVPATPIWIMQKVGVKLGIDPAKLTKEKLEADPASSTSSGSNDV
jgi:hypothetical protein